MFAVECVVVVAAAAFGVGEAVVAAMALLQLPRLCMIFSMHTREPCISQSGHNHFGVLFSSMVMMLLLQPLRL